jgi:hypothetical protein
MRARNEKEFVEYARKNKVSFGSYAVIVRAYCLR